MTLSPADSLRLRQYAYRYTSQGLPGAPGDGPVAVLALAGKAPAVRGGRGVHDATSDAATIRWQLGRRGVTGLGIAIPPWAVVLDVDPRHDGDVALAELEAAHGPLPATLTAMTGRGDGGRHLWWRRPPGSLTGRLGPGLDVKADGGYVVAPPSVHPETGGIYRWEVPAASAAVPPPWLAVLLAPPPVPVQAVSRSRAGCAVGRLTGPSPLAEISASMSWADVLGPRGWALVRGDGDGDGSGWRHPEATSRCSATVRGERLYVWTPNTLFEASGPGSPRGYSRAEALAILDHGGDLSTLIQNVRTTGALT